MGGRAKRAGTAPGGMEDITVRLQLAQGSLQAAREDLNTRIRAAAEMAAHCRATSQAYSLRSSCLQQAMQEETAPSANAEALAETAVRLGRQARAVLADAEHRLGMLTRHRERLDRALEGMARSEARLELVAREAAGREKLRSLGRWAGPGPAIGHETFALEEELRDASRLAHEAHALAELKAERA